MKRYNNLGILLVYVGIVEIGKNTHFQKKNLGILTFEIICNIIYLLSLSQLLKLPSKLPTRLLMLRI